MLAVMMIQHTPKQYHQIETVWYVQLILLNIYVLTIIEDYRLRVPSWYDERFEGDLYHLNQEYNKLL